MPNLELLPCPFCGEQPKVLWSTHEIMCGGEECFGPVATAGNLEDASAQWNKRAHAREWQDISTAKDGVPVLGMNKHGDVGHTHRVESDGDVPTYWWNDQDDDEWHPLWWMPALPPMPNTLIAEERGTK